MALQRNDGFPRTFGPYLLLSSLGRGGMGEVFLAKKRAVSDIDRLCIIKTLRGDLAEHGEYVRRFLDEARVVVQLNHSNICQVYESGRIGSDYVLAMEYIPGVNLKDLAADLLHAGEKLQPGLALYIGEQICEALAYAHRFKSPITGEHLRVVHRDVSPANVMLSFEGEVKLIDFGLAESSLKTEQTETRLVMGKVAYMAPEQARGDDVDGSIDQFAVGVAVYEALTGDRFYGEMNTHQVWQVVGMGTHVPRMWRGLDPDVQAVLGKALAPDREKRYPTCEEFRAALEELRASKYPRSSRAALREMMTKLYGDRIEAERDLIASFSDLRAPTNGGEGLSESPTQKSPRAQWEMGTDPWRNSPTGSSPHIAHAGQETSPPGVSMTSPLLAPPLGEQTPLSGPLPTATLSSQRATVGAAGQSASAAIAPPPNTAGRALAAGAVVVVAAVIAFAVWPRGEPAKPLAVDAGTAAVKPAVVVEAPPKPAAVVDAGTVAAAVIDAGSAPAVIAAVDAGSAAAVVVAPPAKGHTGHRHDTPRAVDAPKGVDTLKVVDTPKVVDPPKVVEAPKTTPKTVDAAKAAADRPLSERDAEDVVNRCIGKVDCAAAIISLPKESDPAKYKSRGFLLQHCAQSCIKAGVARP